MSYAGKCICKEEKKKKQPKDFQLNKYKKVTEYSNMGRRNDQSGLFPV